MKKDLSRAAVRLWSLHMFGTQSSWSGWAQLWCSGPRYHPGIAPFSAFIWSHIAKVWDWLHIVWVWSTVPPGVDHIEPVEPVTIVQGSLVTLSCEARGVPPPTLTWLKDGQPLSLHRNLLLDGRETRLQLPDVAPSDAGLYSCVASNQAGSSTKTFNLTVLGNHTQTCIFKTKTAASQQ